ncbi:CaiB/BaiF CoA transferase family protein [Anaerosphaera multitolerans]|uniref:CoA transferase n=1 Tax=Anaerosphaera multitolerans TaxID=2487351 RepID=A0A437S5I2_9FIRM|nr:CaiB/BaiF CoA-transferase family protein [Anaerosphaera multitolerans]RVU54254.1 CoA transferase [Anaerosphaera multitolerans]
MNNTALSNLKILDFTTLLPGPYATLMLADMGAEVLKISSPSKYDLVLEGDVPFKNSTLTPNALWLNRNKKTLALNLKTKEAIEIIKKLVMEYDIVIEQFRPGIMKKLGLSYEELSKLNPKLIYCSITSYGQNGPDKDRAGHDINFLARSGLMSHSGRVNSGPVLYNTQIADLAGGALHSIIGILAALNYRNLTGQGQYIDISMLDCIIPLNSLDGAGFLAGSTDPRPESGLLNGGSFYDFYKTKDDRYISIASLEPKFLKIFSEAINIPELLRESDINKINPSTKERIKSKIEEKDFSYWREFFSKLDCCVEPVLSLKEALIEDEHIKSRNAIVEMPVGEENTVKQFAMPIKFSKTKACYKHVGREIGNDTTEILKSLGYSNNEIKELKNKNVFK